MNFKQCCSYGLRYWNKEECDYIKNKLHLPVNSAMYRAADYVEELLNSGELKSFDGIYKRVIKEHLIPE